MTDRILSHTASGLNYSACHTQKAMPSAALPLTVRFSLANFSTQRKKRIKRAVQVVITFFPCSPWVFPEPSHHIFIGRGQQALCASSPRTELPQWGTRRCIARLTALHGSPEGSDVVVESISHVHQHEGDGPGLELAGGRDATKAAADDDDAHGVIHGQLGAHGSRRGSAGMRGTGGCVGLQAAETAGCRALGTGERSGAASARPVTQRCVRWAGRAGPSRAEQS